MIFLDRIEVGFDDLDAGGVVYHANYLRLCDRARNKALARCGFDVMPELDRDSVLGVASCEQVFRRPVEMGTYVVATRFVNPSRRSITAEHAVFELGDEALAATLGDGLTTSDKALFTASLRLVAGSLRHRQPGPLPAGLAKLVMAVLVLCAGVIAAPAGFAAPLVVEGDGLSRPDVTREIEYFYDAAGQLPSLEAAARAESRELFRRNGRPNLNLGYMTGTVWIRLAFANATPDADELVLLYDYPSMHEIELAYVDAGGALVRVADAGRRHAFADRAIRHRAFAFRIPLARGHETTVFARLRTVGSLQAPFSIMTPSAFQSRAQDEYLGLGVYYGFILLILVHSLFTFFAIRDRNYATYAAYVVCAMFTQLSLHGISFQYLWPDAVRWNLYATTFFVGLTLVTLSVFTMGYLGTARHGRKMHLLLTAYACIAGAQAIASLVFYGNTTIRIAGLLATTMPLVMLTVGVYSVVRRVQASGFYLLGVLLYSFGAALYGMKDMGLLPNNFVTENGVVLGSALEMCLFSLGLATKMRRLDAERRATMAENAQNLAVASTIQMLAHDVRKPHSLIRMAVDQVERAQDIDAARRVVARLRPSLKRALDSVDGMLEDVMEVGSKASPVLAPVAPAALIESVVADLTLERPERRRMIRIAVGDVGPVAADARKLARALTNMVENALQATPEGGEIVISTAAEAEGDAGSVTFRVFNSGSYIAPEERARVFDAFFTSKKARGTGLGLAISKKIVLAHGGRVGCDSVQGVGTTFSFTIRRARAAADAADAAGAAAAAVALGSHLAAPGTP